MSAREGRHKPGGSATSGGLLLKSLGFLFSFYAEFLTASSIVELINEASFGRKEAMKVLVSRFLSDEAGATAIEYGLLAALISVVIIGAVKLAGSNLSSTFTNIGNNLS